jgi:ATP-dependent Clp protease ATP-binding subunit ClpA
MFERFTKASRLVVQDAVGRAQTWGADAVGVEHVLAGLAASDSLAGRVLHELGAHELAVEEAIRTGRHEARLLGTLGIDLDEVRASAEQTFGPGAWHRSRRRRHLPFTPAAKAVIAGSLRHGRRLRSRTLEPTHLLLAVLDAGGPAAEVLAALQVDPARIRSRLLSEEKAA